MLTNQLEEVRRSSGNDEGTFGSRNAFGSDVSGLFRGVGTSFEIKDVPHFSKSDPQYVPSPAAFVAQKLFTVVAYYYVHEYAAVEPRFALNHDLLLPSRVPFFARLSGVSQEEVFIRVIVAVTCWLKD